MQKYQYDIDYLFNEHNEKDYVSNNDTRAIQRELENNLMKKKQIIIF